MTYSRFAPKLRKYRILGLGIWNTAQEIRNPSDDWSQESKFHRRRTGIQNPLWGIQNPRLSS